MAWLSAQSWIHPHYIWPGLCWSQPCPAFALWPTEAPQQPPAGGGQSPSAESANMKEGTTNSNRKSFRQLRRGPFRRLQILRIMRKRRHRRVAQTTRRRARCDRLPGTPPRLLLQSLGLQQPPAPPADLHHNFEASKRIPSRAWKLPRNICIVGLRRSLDRAGTHP